MSVSEERWKSGQILGPNQETEKLLNVKVMVILIVDRAIPKNQVKRLNEIEIWGRIETIQTTVLLKSQKY